MQDFDIQQAQLGDHNNLIKRIIKLTYRIWPFVLVSVVICLILTLLYLKSTNSIYKTHAQIIVDDDKNSGNALLSGGSGSDMSMASIFSGSKNVDNELGVIKSSKIADKTVKDLQLNVTFYIKKKLSKELVFGDQLPFNFQFVKFNEHLLNLGTRVYEVTVLEKGLSLYRKNESTISVPYNVLVHIPEGDVLFSPTALLSKFINNKLIFNISSNKDATILYKSMMNASNPDKNTSIIEMGVNSSNPLLAETYLNQFIKNYLEYNIASKKQSADSTIAFVNGRIGNISNELTSIEKNIQTFKQSNTIADISSQATSLVTNSGTASQELMAQRIQLSILNSLIDYMRKNEEHPRIVPASLSLNTPTLNSIITNYNTLLMTREKLLESYQPESDNITSIDKQIALLRSDMFSNMETLKRTLEIQVTGAHSTVSDLETQLRKVPNQERVYLDLSRRQNVEQELYVFLLQQKEQAYLAKSATQPGAKVLEDPTTDNFPIFPSKMVFLSFGLLVGLLIPYLVYYILEFLRTKITNKEDIKNFSNIPIVGEIGEIKKSESESNIIEVNNNRNIIAEQFRIMRTNIQYLFNNKESKTILFTSSISGEGKSFVASNLANFLAVTGKKVALLELDLRKPSITKKLNVSPKKGISDFAIGNATYNEIKYLPKQLNGVTLFSAGHIPPNPSEMLLSPNIQLLFTHLKEEYDYIIVDCAPLIVTDAQILSNFSDVTLFVLRMNYTLKEQLKEIDEIYKEKKLKNLNFIVNAIDYSKYSNYNTYGSYGKSKYYSSYISES